MAERGPIEKRHVWDEAAELHDDLGLTYDEIAMRLGVQRETAVAYVTWGRRGYRHESQRRAA